MVLKHSQTNFKICHNNKSTNRSIKFGLRCKMPATEISLLLHINYFHYDCDH